MKGSLQKALPTVCSKICCVIPTNKAYLRAAQKVFTVGNDHLIRLGYLGFLLHFYLYIKCCDNSRTRNGCPILQVCLRFQKLFFFCTGTKQDLFKFPKKKDTPSHAPEQGWWSVQMTLCKLCSAQLLQLELLHFAVTGGGGGRGIGGRHRGRYY